MSVVINNEHFERMNCGQCGIVFYVPLAFFQERVNDGDGWQCPNGHRRVFTEPKVQKLEKQLQEKEKEIQRLKTDRVTFKAGLDNREKELVKLRKRIKKMKVATNGK